MTADRADVIKVVAGYTALRIALLVAVTLVLVYLPLAFGVDVPLLLAVLVAIVLQLPMAWLLFPAQRHRVATVMAQRSNTRVDERARLRAALAGEVTDDSRDT